RASSSPSSAAGQSHPPGATRTDAHGVEQVWVPAGTFTMGSDDTSLTPPAWAKDEAPSERPGHEVAISKGYWIDRTEATNASFKAFADAGGYTNRALWSDKGWTWLGLQNPSSLPRPCAGDDPDLPPACHHWFESARTAHSRARSV